MDVLIERNLLNLEEKTKSIYDIIAKCRTIKDTLYFIINLPLTNSELSDRKELLIPQYPEDLTILNDFGELYTEEFKTLLGEMVNDDPAYKLFLLYANTPPMLEYGMRIEPKIIMPIMLRYKNIINKMYELIKPDQGSP